MANFTTHIAVGTLVSGTLATVTLAADAVAPENLVAVTLAGVVGSVLPDIDLKDSRPSRSLFSGLAVFFSFAVLFSVADKYSVAELWLLWLGTLLGVRYIAHAVFHRMSYHRGIYHSILAAIFFALFTAVAFKHMIGRPDGVAWLAAGFMFAGYMTHLVLDEIYSVDVLDTRIKASFGTAVKLIDTKHYGHSAAMGVATVLAFLLTPSAKMFVDGARETKVRSVFMERLLPKNRNVWFGVDIARLGAENRWFKGLAPKAPPASANTVTTGSISPASPAAAPSETKPAQ
jgi:membrane-bound metal-dependent hydrolase YbcI (DUF457 family)